MNFEEHAFQNIVAMKALISLNNVIQVVAI